MPVRTRNSSGRFESTEKSIFDAPIPVEIPKQWVSVTLRWVILVVVFAPWLLILFRVNIYSSISSKVNEFYDENISCKSYCLSLPQNCTIPSEKIPEKKNGNF